MKRLLSALAATGTAITLAACGGSQPTKPVTPVTTSVNGHACNPKDATIQCFTPHGIAAPLSPSAASSVTAYGVDFGWSCAVSAARNFGVSYLSYDASKDWTRSCIATFHAQHKTTLAVWEAGASDATGGASLGRAQVQTAIAELNALGAGPRQPIIMAIDCDCAGASLVGYFQGANSANGSHPVEAYGGYDQLNYLYGRHLIGHANWQTLAWSGGRWLPATIAPLEQYAVGSSTDSDRALAAYYGQWPYNPPKSKPIVPRCYRSHWPQPNTPANLRLCNQVRKHDSYLGLIIKHQDGYLTVTNGNIASLDRQIAQLEAQRGSDLSRHTAELRARDAAAGSLAADLKTYGFTG